MYSDSSTHGTTTTTGDWAVLMGRLQSLLDVSPVMLIMRGVPGSGKSTLVHTIVEGFPESLVCSADHYFEKENGEYVFDGKLLKDAHADCQRRARDAMSGGVPLVVIDNTCVKYWEYKKYEAMAAEAGYQVQIASLECDSIAVGVLARLLAGRNSHQVPEATILNMLRNWYNDERSFKIEIRGLPGSDEQESGQRILTRGKMASTCMTYYAYLVAANTQPSHRRPPHVDPPCGYTVRIGIEFQSDGSYEVVAMTLYCGGNVQHFNTCNTWRPSGEVVTLDIPPGSDTFREVNACLGRMKSEPIGGAEHDYCIVDIDGTRYSMTRYAHDIILEFLRKEVPEEHFDACEFDVCDASADQ